jgi:hypothetical protein
LAGLHPINQLKDDLQNINVTLKDMLTYHMEATIRKQNGE